MPSHKRNTATEGGDWWELQGERVRPYVTKLHANPSPKFCQAVISAHQVSCNKPHAACAERRCSVMDLRPDLQELGVYVRIAERLSNWTGDAQAVMDVFDIVQKANQEKAPE
jgi:hypothetical protein